MWGPSFSAFTMDQDITLFEVSWNESGGTSAITTILGQQFGGAISGSTSGTIGAKFVLEGFTTGEVEVKYPVEITLDMPTDNTYNTGETITINTSYVVGNGYELNTWFPQLGEARLDLYFQMYFNVSATLCAFGCVNFDIIPPLNIPLTTVNILTANIGGVSVAEGMMTYPGLPYELPDNDYGISGEITVPFVETDDNLVGTDLVATGDSAYIHVALEIFQFIGGLNIPYVSAVLGNLSGSYDLGSFSSVYGATAWYNIFSASFNAYNTTHQEFRFEPTLYGRFNFPTPVYYSVLAGAATVSSGFGSIIDFEVGNNVELKFPCHYEWMDIATTYSIEPLFSNHTYDEISFDFSMSALEFGIDLPSIVIIPEICVPEICIPYAYPCPTWRRPWRWCTGWACTPAFCTPEVAFPGWSFSIGPLWEHTIPIGAISYDWFNETWMLEGFTDQTVDAFRIRARPFLSNSTHTDIACFGDQTGAVDLTLTNGTAPFSYTWNNGATTEDITNLAAGNYHVTVYDVNGCQTFTGETILGPDSPVSLSALEVDKSCNGGANDGEISLSAQGGTPGYSYLWSNGATTQNITNLDAGMYSVTVTDANGCQSVLSRSVGQPDVLQIASSSITPVDCFGNATGSISISVSGGTTPYSYSWSNGMSGSTISGLTSNSYSVTITDARGCTTTDTYDVMQPSVMTLSSVIVPVDCFGNSTGAVQVTALGGNGGNTYSWTNQNNVVLSNQTLNLSGIGTGTYTIAVTDNNGCREELSSFVPQPLAPLEASYTKEDVSCNGNSTGSIDLTPFGGTSPYNYNWSNGFTGEDPTNLSAGDYSVTLTDDNGCIATYNYTIEEPLMPLSGTIIIKDVSCFGGSDGQIISSISGGTSPYSYNWSNGETTPTIINLSSGNYTLDVTDAKGCTINFNPFVDQPPVPLTLSSTQVDVACHNDNTGSIDLTVIGGTAGYTYQWSNSSSFILSTIEQDLTNLSSDTYMVKVTDENGCIDSLQITINQPAEPIQISFVETAVNCFGGADGAIDITVTGGTIGYDYSWSGGETSEDLANISAGNHTVVVTDANACQETITVTVLEPMAPLIGEVFTRPVKCNGEATGEIDLTVQGGTTPYQYNWSNGSANEDLEFVVGGLYTVDVTDANGCMITVGGFVSQPANPLNVVVTMNEPSCYAYSDGSIELTVSGGTTPYYFGWGDENEFLLNNPSEILDGLPVNDYLYRVRDKNDCVVQGIVTVTQPDTISMSASVIAVSCFDGNDGVISVVSTGGTLPYTYAWDSGQTTSTIDNLNSGEYDVVMEDANGCRYSDSYFVPQASEIHINSEVIPVSCIDQTDGAIYIQTAGGTQPYSWNWSTGELTQNIENLPPGSYNLQIFDANNCTKSYDFIIPENEGECLTIVNSFTPNGDNYNDTWIIRNIELYPEASVNVYNRWGNIVFESKGEYIPWDGSYKGEQLPSEVYYYIIVLNNNEDNKYTGTITIVR